MFMAGMLLLGLATLAWFFPRALTYPLIALMLWISLALLYRAYRMRNKKPLPGANPETVRLKQRE